MNGERKNGAPDLSPLDSINNLVINFELEGPYEGPSDDYFPGGEAYNIHAKRGQVEIGQIKMTILPEEQELFVNWVEVPKALRRQGIATALCVEALRLWPGYLFGTSGLTDDGERFWFSIEKNLGTLEY